MVLPTRNRNPAELLSQLLDRGYLVATRDVVNAIANNANRGILAERLNQLDAEAQRLNDAGEKLTANNPVLRATLADFETVLNGNAGIINGNADSIQQAGIDAANIATRELTLPGLNDAQLARIGIAWNRPSPEAIARVVRYTRSEAWADQLRRYAENNLDTVRNIALRGIVNGQNPLQTARQLRQTIGGLPVSTANTMMRTLQLQSYRDAAVVNQLQNADFLQPMVVRVAVLDDRVCMACVALHGSLVPLGQTIDDHHQGRCLGIPQVVGRTRVIRTGPEWFDSLPPERQLALAGPGKLEALRSGSARFEDFVHHYRDPVFGDMVREASLSGILSRPSRQVRTVNGMITADTGKPGESIADLRAFLRDSDGPLARAMFDETGLLDYTADGYVINRDGVRESARRFVRESQDITYSRDIIISYARQQAAGNGVIVRTQLEAEGLVNQQYARQADAILSAARIGRVRLTEAQYRRLGSAFDGGYLDMVYSREGSETGSLANAVERRKRDPKSGMSDLERETRRQEFIERFRLNK